MKFAISGTISTFCVLMVTGALSYAQSPAAPLPSSASSPGFEVATVKLVEEPNPGRMNDRTEGRRFTTRYTTLRDLIMMAYSLDPRQISGGPAWIATDEYDVEGVASDEAQLADHREAMLQKLLTDRFQLAFHHEQKEMPVYILVVGKGGPKLKATDSSGQQGSGCEHLGRCTFKNDTLQHFARWMQFVVLDKPVVDKTGLAGGFDFSLNWTPDESQFTGMGVRVPPPADNPNAPPGLFTAIQEQLGLKLEPRKIAAEILVIDHVDRPSEN